MARAIEREKYKDPCPWAGTSERRKRPPRPRSPALPLLPRLRTPASAFRSSRRARSPAPPSPPSPSARPGPLPSRRPGIPRASCPRRSHCRRESRSPTTGTARRHLREHRLPDTGGPYPFTINATNGVIPDATQSFTLTVNQAPGITSPAGTTFTAGQAGTPLPSRRVGCPTPHCPRRAHCRPGSRSPTTGTARRQSREHRLRTPAVRTRSRSPPRTVSILPPPRPSPSRSTRRAGSPARPAPPLTSARPGPLPSRRRGGPTAHCPRRAHCRRGSRSPTTGTARRHFREHRPPDGVYPFTIIARNGVGADATQSFTLTFTRRPGSPAPTTPPLPPARPGTFTVTTSGVPTPGLSEKGGLPRGVKFKDNGDGTATLAGTPAPGYRRYVPVHDHRHERCQSCRHPVLHPHRRRPPGRAEWPQSHG